MSSSFTSLVLIFFAIAIATVAAKEFQVGGHVGWRIPVANESELYNVWASRRRFHIGDTLRFRYDTDSVVTVDKYGFYHCDPTQPIDYSTNGDTLVKLNKPGNIYFISGNRKNCYEGQRMIVHVIIPKHVRPTKAVAPYNPYVATSPSQSQGLGSSIVTGSGSDVLVPASVMGYVALVTVLVYSY
ncbi:early nodulin-like protein 7 [Rutidosis leptorrhynchoides]|uniref:early nodulin-like protein 7 n=1 Tax=Rutidosis leptorrhynchoides TaxID=125765 RepID=UPI003A993303